MSDRADKVFRMRFHGDPDRTHIPYPHKKGKKSGKKAKKVPIPWPDKKPGKKAKKVPIPWPDRKRKKSDEKVERQRDKVGPKPKAKVVTKTQIKRTEKVINGIKDGIAFGNIDPDLVDLWESDVKDWEKILSNLKSGNIDKAVDIYDNLDTESREYPWEFLGDAEGRLLANSLSIEWGDPWEGYVPFPPD